MKKILLSGIIAFFSTAAVNAQTNITTARGAAINSTVVTKGICLNGSELGSIRYFQDNTGGLAVFSAAATAGINRGDSIKVSGPLTTRYGVLQIATTTVGAGVGVPVVITATPGGTLPAPQIVTNTQLLSNAENIESKLVKIQGGMFQQSGNFATNTNYTVTFSSGPYVEVRISSSAIVGTPIPSGLVDITGLVGQFCNPIGTTTCVSGYQLIPRDLNDIVASSVGINEISKNSTALSIYPNPSNTSINFKIALNETVASTIITDVTGRIVFKSNENTTTVNVSTLANGIYNISVATSTNNYKSKFIVAK